MPANRPSRTGKRDAGYTLVELLVVLAIMGLLLAAAPAIIRAARPGIEVKTAAQMLANDLRAARATAIANNADTWIVVDAEKHAYSVEPRGKIKSLPRDASVLLRGPRGEDAGVRAAVRFYPDGSSNGGSVGIAAHGRQHWITAHWLTGRITIHD